MTAAFRSAGAFVNGTGGITPVAGTTVTGDGIIVYTGERIGSDTITAPGGWTEFSANSNAPQLRVFGKIATGGTGVDTIPTFNWSATVSAWAIVLVYSGINSSFTTGGAASDRLFSGTSDVACPAVSRTPSVAGCLCSYYGFRNKTATANGATFTPPTNFTVRAQQSVAGTAVSVVIGDWIQTTATLIASNQTYSGSIVDTSQSSMSGLFILQPGAGGGGTTSSRLALMGVGS